MTFEHIYLNDLSIRLFNLLNQFQFSAVDLITAISQFRVISPQCHKALVWINFSATTVNIELSSVPQRSTRVTFNATKVYFGSLSVPQRSILGHLQYQKGRSWVFFINASSSLKVMFSYLKANGSNNVACYIRYKLGWP